jgi:hypothetical protein
MRGENQTMMDFLMILTLAGVFGVFLLFLKWCGHIVDEGGEGR